MCSVADQRPKPVSAAAPSEEDSARLLQLALQYEEAGLWLRSSGDCQRGEALLERAEAIHQRRTLDRDNAQVGGAIRGRPRCPVVISANQKTELFFSTSIAGVAGPG